MCYYSWYKNTKYYRKEGAENLQKLITGSTLKNAIIIGSLIGGSYFLIGDPLMLKYPFEDKIQGALPNIIAIVMLLLLGPVIIKRVLCRSVSLRVQNDNARKRLETITKLLASVGNVALVLISLLLFLDIFSIDMKPILAGLGIVGFALGFACQNIAKDFISGIFVLGENQYAVGEAVRIGTFEGKVINITLRVTILEGAEGEISIPNGTVAGSGIINLSRKKKE